MGTGYLGKKAMANGLWIDNNDSHFYYRAVWVKRFAWRPRRCNLTGGLLWLKPVMMGVAMYAGPGDPVFDFRWHDYKEHTVWLLKQ
jgi:hypothetical protein